MGVILIKGVINWNEPKKNNLFAYLKRTPKMECEEFVYYCADM